MIGSSFIDLSLANVWRSWFKFRRGKRRTLELEKFEYYLENNLHKLHLDLNSGGYRHGDYKEFIVCDNKRREIRVAGIRDRIVHRILYDYLTAIYDKTFIFDVWSCRKKKGLIGAIERAESFLSKHPVGHVWRADIKKFFDNVDRNRLRQALSLRITSPKDFQLLDEVINSYSKQSSKRSSLQKGVPIGNLTSQIFANIYLNELDRFVKHNLKLRMYLRYGDDFIIISNNSSLLHQARAEVINFLKENLLLEINRKNDIIIDISRGLKYLGVEIFSKGRRLNKRSRRKAKANLNLNNVSSYCGLIRQHSHGKKIKELNWRILEKLNEIS